MLAELPAEAEDVLDALPAAEAEILRALARGCSHARIAAQRGTALQTIANQISSPFDKLGISGRRELQRLLARRG